MARIQGCPGGGVGRAVTSHPARSKRLQQQAHSKLLARECLTGREAASLDYYRRRIPQLWPGDDPALYDYRTAMGLIDRRPILIPRASCTK